jgi:hypothetical protein
MDKALVAFVDRFLSHPLFAVLLAPVLVVLGVAGVNWIVVLSVLIAWIVAFLWIARIEPIRNLTIIARIVVLTVCGLVLALGLKTFGTWAIQEHAADQAKSPEPLRKILDQKAKEAPTITWDNPSPIIFGTPLSANQLNAAASVRGKAIDGDFVYDPTFGATLQIGTQTLHVKFIPRDLTAYAEKEKTILIVVKPRQKALPPTAPTQPLRQPQEASPPDLGVMFFSQAGEPRFVIFNAGDTAGLRPKWTIALSDYTNEYYPHYKSDPNSSEPLPIPTAEQDDFVKGHSYLGNFEILNNLTLQYVQPGDRLFGVLSISCMNCPGARQYWFYWKMGESGWYAPFSPVKEGARLFKEPNLSDAEIDMLILNLVPLESRIAIKEGQAPGWSLTQQYM